MKIETGATNPDHKLIPTDIEAQNIMTHTDAAPDHTIGSTKYTIEAVHYAHPPPLIYTDPTVTHHITDHLHIEALPLTPEITVGHTLNPTYTSSRKRFTTNLLHVPADHKAKHISHITPE